MNTGFLSWFLPVYAVFRPPGASADPLAVPHPKSSIEWVSARLRNAFPGGKTGRNDDFFSLELEKSISLLVILIRSR